MWWRRKPESLGARGEQAAVRHLKRHGYRIEARNVRLGRCEVDIIARDGDTLVFVEVRSRGADDDVPPEDSIGAEKQAHLLHAARQYMARHPDPDQYYRFDVVAVVFGATGRPAITLYRDAFQA